VSSASLSLLERVV